MGPSPIPLHFLCLPFLQWRGVWSLQSETSSPSKARSFSQPTANNLSTTCVWQPRQSLIWNEPAGGHGIKLARCAAASIIRPRWQRRCSIAAAGSQVITPRRVFLGARVYFYERDRLAGSAINRAAIFSDNTQQRVALTWRKTWKATPQCVLSCACLFFYWRSLHSLRVSVLS